MSQRPTVSAAAEPPWSEVIGPRGRIQLALLTLLIGWLYWDQLARMVQLWSEGLDWSHGFLILPFCAYCLHTRRAALARVTARPAWSGLLLLLVGIGVYAYSIRARYGYPQPVSMLVVIAGAVLLTGGWGLLRHTLFPIGFLLLAIPPPDRRYREFTQHLQQAAAWIAEHLLRYLPKLVIERNGFSLTAISDTDGRILATFTVAGACSGMRSLLAFMAIGLAMAYLTPRPTWHRLSMALIVFPVALLCNVLRVLATGTLMIYQLGDMAQGTPHMVLGLMTFGLGIAFYTGFLYVLDHLFVDEAPAPATPGGDAAA